MGDNGLIFALAYALKRALAPHKPPRRGLISVAFTFEIVGVDRFFRAVFFSQRLGSSFFFFARSFPLRFFNDGPKAIRWDPLTLLVSALVKRKSRYQSVELNKNLFKI